MEDQTLLADPHHLSRSDSFLPDTAGVLLTSVGRNDAEWQGFELSVNQKKWCAWKQCGKGKYNEQGTYFSKLKQNGFLEAITDDESNYRGSSVRWLVLFL